MPFLKNVSTHLLILLWGKVMEVQAKVTVKPHPYPFNCKTGIRCSYLIQELKENDKGEDRMGIGFNVNNQDTDFSFVAVFDGHAGKRAAEYSANNIEKILKEQIPQLGFKEGLEAASVILNNNLKKEHKDDRSGTTSLILLQNKNTIYSSWVGDSETVLVNKNGIIEMSHPIHDVESSLELIKETAESIKEPFEYTYLQAAKEFESFTNKYQYWFSSNNTKITIVQPEALKNFSSEVYTSIGVSRSIGDPRFGKLLSPDSDITVQEIDTHHIAILGSDGLWDKVTRQDVNEFIKNNCTGCDFSIEDLLNEDPENFQIDNAECHNKIKKALQFLATALMELACERWGNGFKDDISIIVSWLNFTPLSIIEAKQEEKEKEEEKEMEKVDKSEGSTNEEIETKNEEMESENNSISADNDKESSEELDIE